MKKLFFISFSCLSIYLVQHTVLDDTTIPHNIDARALEQLLPQQKQEIEKLLKPLSHKQTQNFFKSFNRHYKKALVAREKDTVGITLAKLHYHQPSSLVAADLDPVIKTAYKHATT